MMGPDDFHDLGLCPDCERDMTIGELHTADCPVALAQDADDQDADLEGYRRNFLGAIVCDYCGYTQGPIFRQHAEDCDR